MRVFAGVGPPPTNVINIETLIIRIGFRGTIIIIRNPQNSIGNDLGPYILNVRGSVDEQSSWEDPGEADVGIEVYALKAAGFLLRNT